MGQICQFYCDTHRLRIQAHAPRQPQVLTTGLRCEIEKYDQIVDRIDSQLHRAISVLQRDLQREEQRAKQEELLKSGEAQPLAVSSTPPTPAQTAQSADEPLPLGSPESALSGPIARRPSAISISSLHRPTVPLKLDLSSSSLRFSGDESSIFSGGLASPVTLAPKSARGIGPNDYPPELMALVSSRALERPVDIDLTVADGAEEKSFLNIGDSAEKPIDLDIDTMDIDVAMRDIFGDSSPTNMFVPSDVDNHKPAKADALYLDVSQSNNQGDIFGVSEEKPGDVKSSNLFTVPDTTASGTVHGVTETQFDLGSLDLTSILENPAMEVDHLLGMDMKAGDVGVKEEGSS